MTDSAPIIDLLRSSFAIRHDPWRVEDAVDAMSVFPANHIAALAEALTDQDDELRLLAVEVLYSLGQKAEPALSALIESLDDEDRIVRVAVVAPVAAFGHKAAAAVPILESWLPSDDEFSRVTAAAAIIRIDPSRADDVLPVLIHALESDDYGIRCHATWSTGRIGEVAWEAIPALRQLRGEDSTLRHLADEAITNITGEAL